MGKTALATKIAFGAAKALLAEARARPTRTRPPKATVGDLLAGNERRAARHPPAQRRGAHLRRPHPPRRHRPARLRQVRAGVSREIAALPIEIDDTPAITLSALRTRCRRLKRTKGLALVVVDYLQLMRPAAGHQAGEPRAGDRPDHPGAEGDRQGAGGAGAGAVAAFARGREARGQAAAAFRPA